MHCPHCGKTIPNEVSFCAYCGVTTRPQGRSLAFSPYLIMAALLVFLGLAAGTFIAWRVLQIPPAAPTQMALATNTSQPVATVDVRYVEPTATQTSVPTPSSTETGTLTPTRTPTWAPTATPFIIIVTPTYTPPPTATYTPVPVPTAVREWFPLRLVDPPDRAVFKDENLAPLLEWKPVTNGALAPEEYYRIQVYHSRDQLNCNLYTKNTFFQLPPSGKEPCDPAIWKFNTGDYNWRITFVVRVDQDTNHDKELINSEGRLFKWNK